MVLIGRAAIGGAKPGDVLQILHTDRQAAQDGQGITSCGLLVGGASADTGAVEVPRDHGVHRVVHGLDPVDAALQQLDGGQLLRTDQGADLHGIEIARFSHRLPSSNDGRPSAAIFRTSCSRWHPVNRGRALPDAPLPTFRRSDWALRHIIGVTRARRRQIFACRPKISANVP